MFIILRLILYELIVRKQLFYGITAEKKPFATFMYLFIHIYFGILAFVMTGLIGSPGEWERDGGAGSGKSSSQAVHSGTALYVGALPTSLLAPTQPLFF